MADKKKELPSLLAFLLWLLLMTLALVSTARGENRALLIGVGRYANFGERLDGVDRDVDMMAEVARLVGFKRHEIKVLQNEGASTARVAETVEDWLIKDVGPDDRVLFYFSGHGSQVPDEDGDEKDQFDEVLLLYDVALSEKSGRQTLTGVLVDDHFNHMLAKMKSRNVLVILDACHSGSATRSLRPTARSTLLYEAKVKYFYYSPILEAAGGRGSFDVIKPADRPSNGSRYVALTACRDDEKTVATARGSIFTLALWQIVQSASVAGTDITPEGLQISTTRFIQDQIRFTDDVFHPQIAGNIDLIKRPLQLVSGIAGKGAIRKKLEKLVYKGNERMWLKLNKTCFEPGDVLEISVWLPEPGYLNIINIAANDQATVLFPNKYHPDNAVDQGKMTIPGRRMEFEMVTDDDLRPNLIAAFLTQSPLNTYQDGFETFPDVFAGLSSSSMRALMMRQVKGWLAAGRVAAEIREKGLCH